MKLYIRNHLIYTFLTINSGLPIFCNAQNEVLKTNCYYYTSGFCGTHIYLNSDSTFTQSMSCESSQTITCGRYFLISDSIILKSYKLEEFKLFSIEKTSSTKSKYKTLKIIDKNKNPVSGVEVRLMNDSNEIESPYEEQKRLWSDEKGKIEIPDNVNYIEIIQFSSIYKRKYIIKMDKLNSEITIRLNFICFFTGSSFEVGYREFDYPKKMMIKNSCLIRNDHVFQPCE